MHCKWCGAGGGLSSLTWGGVCGRLGGLGVVAGVGIGGAGRVAVNSLLVLGKCVLSPSS